MKKAYLKIGLLLISCNMACNSKTASTSSKGRSSSNLQGQDASNATGSADSINKFLTLKNAIEKRRPDLEREKDRRGKLMLQLMANIGAGCMGDTKINIVEIIIDGDKLSDNDVSALKQTDQYLPQATAGQTNFEFYLGDMSRSNYITFTNNELQNTLFATNAHLTYSVPQDKMFKINFVNMLSIKKTVPAYSRTNFCLDYEGKPIKNCSMQNTIKEVERYRMNSLTVKVNGFTLYTNGNVHHVFAANPGVESDTKSYSLSWQENNAQLNDAFIRLLQRTDCPMQ